MAKRYTVTSERASDTKGEPVRVIADSEDDALERAARRVHGRRAEWHPMGAAEQNANGERVYPGHVVAPRSSMVRGATDTVVLTDRALWSVTVGWPARAPEGEHLFRVRVDDGSVPSREVWANTARDAAETFWRRRVMRGDAPASMGDRVVVEHACGSDVDPSVTWHRDEEGGPFAVFLVRVLDVQVAAEVAS